MLNTLQGKNAILTGGSQGLGPLIARALSDRGVNVALVARSRDKLEEVSAGIPRSIPVPGDLTDLAGLEAIVQNASSQLGPIDILINNAGVENGGCFLGRTPAEIEQVVATNVLAPLLLTRLVLPGMVERGSGHIVTVASTAGKMALPFAATYSGSKAAVLAWGNSLFVELEGTGVSHSLVSPGFVADVGMFASKGTSAPGFLGSVKPAQVVDGVVRCLVHGDREVLVTAKPLQPLQVFFALAPNQLLKLMKKIGLFEFLERNFDRGGSRGDARSAPWNK